MCVVWGDAPLVVEAILRRHPQCRKRKNILSENVRRCAEAAQKCDVEAPFRMPIDEPRRAPPRSPQRRFRAAARAVIAAKRLESPRKSDFLRGGVRGPDDVVMCVVI